MKSLIALFFVIFSQAGFASDIDLSINQPINAEIEVSYYRNLMPRINPDPNHDVRVFTVKAVVEFCRTVSADEFAIVVTEIPAGNLVQLYSKNGPLLDCFGPTHKQTLSYRLPENADKDLPFFSAKFAPIQFRGDVH